LISPSLSAMAATSVASPLCTWLVAACMSVSCDGDYSSRPSRANLGGGGARRRRLAASNKCTSSCCLSSRGLISGFSGSSIQGLMSSCLAFEPCDEYYSSRGLSSLGSNGLSSLFGSKTGSTNRSRRRINGAAHSGNWFLSFGELNYRHCWLEFQVLDSCRLCCCCFSFCFFLFSFIQNLDFLVFIY
jgi:hypothetical protein